MQPDILLLLLAVLIGGVAGGFAGGYALREYISRRRHQRWRSEL